MRNQSIIIGCALLLCGCANVLGLDGDPTAAVLSETSLETGDQNSLDQIGGAVSIDGDRAIIGTTGGAGTGFARIYELVNGEWLPQTLLLADDGAPGDLFGSAVAIQGDYAIVAAPGDEDAGFKTGAIYIFQRIGESWSQRQKIVPNNASQAMQFGSAVAMDSGTAIVGAKGNTAAATSRSGAAYIYDLNETTEAWGLTTVLPHNSPADFFGSSVDIKGDTAIVGAPNGNFAQVYLRAAGEWNLDIRLTAGADDEVDTAVFGSSVAVDKVTAVVGDHLADDSGVGFLGFDAGTAYVFTRVGGGWREEQRLKSGDDLSEFGTSVAISDDTIVLGAPGAFVRGSGDSFIAGGAFVFTRDDEDWTAQAKITSSISEPSEKFGSSLSLSGNRVLLGSPLRPGPSSEPEVGAATLFELSFLLP